MRTPPATASGTHRLLEDRVAVSIDAPPHVTDRVGRLLARFEDPSPQPATRWELRGHAVGCGQRTFTVTRDGVVVRRTVHASVGLAALLHGLHTGAVASVMTTHLMMHAGAVHRDGRGLLVVGPPSAGKSTLTAALIRAGLDHVADETTPIELTTGRLRAYPRHLDLDPDARARVGRPAGATTDGDGLALHVLPEELRPGCGTLGAEGGEVRWIVLPIRRGPGREPTLEPLRPAEAVAELTAHTFDFPRLGGRALRTLATVIERAACYRLVAGTVHETADLVARLVHTDAALSARATT